MKKFIIGIVIFLLIGCGGSSAIATAIKNTPISTSAIVAQFSTATPLPAPATFTPAPVPMDTPTTEPSPTPLSVPEVHTGNGDSIVTLNWSPDTPAIIKFTHTGDHNFAVWSIDANNNQNRLLVNATGNYGGIVPINFERDKSTIRLQITADGAWQASVQPLAAARQFRNTAPISGSGDEVIILLTGKTFDTATITGNSAGRLFAIWAYTDSTTDLLVNTTDPYQGEVLLPNASTIIFVINAETGGRWSIQPSVH